MRMLWFVVEMPKTASRIRPAIITMTGHTPWDARVSERGLVGEDSSSSCGTDAGPVGGGSGCCCGGGDAARGGGGGGRFGGGAGLRNGRFVPRELGGGREGSGGCGWLAVAAAEFWPRS